MGVAPPYQTTMFSPRGHRDRAWLACHTEVLRLQTPTDPGQLVALTRRTNIACCALAAVNEGRDERFYEEPWRRGMEYYDWNARSQCIR